ncbi:hypothetical protein HDU96_003891 [Phlyctochytrium bullatum]|nr:hypothetical protein HDU96_003891 [Phlyctochytrium bullatum]
MFMAFTFMSINGLMCILHIMGAAGVLGRNLSLIYHHAVVYNFYAAVAVVKLPLPFIRGPAHFSLGVAALVALMACVHVYFAIVVWSNYQLERFKAANAGAAIVTSADVDVEADAVHVIGKAYPPAASK